MSLKAAANAVVTRDALITGEVTIGEETLVHPGAQIIAEAGPIEIGAECEIQELAVIRNTRPEKMVIGSKNVFEVGATVEAKSIGDGNVFAARSFVGSKVAVTDRCVVGVTVRVEDEEELGPGTVTWVDSRAVGRGHRVVPTREGPGLLYTQQLKKLLAMIPKYNELIA
mmetsp:Transcript_16803/g.43674  ORF Transcript_16803/g.43674 Transcript_16803/m.43674 type:complete len:169 (+) Transcript_16803:85-591(+)